MRIKIGIKMGRIRRIKIVGIRRVRIVRIRVRIRIRIRRARIRVRTKIKGGTCVEDEWRLRCK